MKIELELPDKPEVHAIASALNIDPDAVVGKLIRVWQWFDKHTTDGNAKSVTCSLLNRIAGVTGFAEAMQKVSWLVITDDGIQVPNFQKHNGATAKNRADTARRVTKCRGKSSEEGVAKKREILPRPIREAVLKRDNHTCVYCSRPEGKYFHPETQSDASLHIDHVIPVVRGGSDDISNLATACAVCNLLKSDRTPDECGLAWPMVDGVKLGNVKNVTDALPREEKIREDIKPSTSHPGAGAKFAMFATWKPSAHLPDLAKQAMVEIKPEKLGEFIAYWLTQPLTQRTQAEWDKALLQSAKHDKLHAESNPTLPPGGRPTKFDPVEYVNGGGQPQQPGGDHGRVIEHAA